ncbi:ion channel protein [Streptomyces sp. NPDC002004]
MNGERGANETPGGPARGSPGGGSPGGGSPGRPSPFRPTPQARALLPLAVPALLIGIGSSLMLYLLDTGANWLRVRIWQSLPGALGIDGYGPGWTAAVLTATGVVVGLVVWKVPGHAGPDPAGTGLSDPPLPVRVLPGIAVTAVLGLAGGVSLGPENPITSINIALAFALGVRAMPRTPTAAWGALAAAGTIGALFDTPVAAALVMSEPAATGDPRPLWDRLFAPLIAAAAGALTTRVVKNETLAVNAAPYPGPRVVDVFSAMVIATAAAAIALVAVYALPHVHALFHRLRNPVLMLTAGGLVLGGLGALGGPLTLFKGLTEMKQLVAHPDEHSAGNLALLAVVKLAALVVATASGFRGGRIFPAVFVGTALGMLAHALVTAVPSAIAITSGVLGVLLATTRLGWLSLFTAVAVALDIDLLPALCVATLPAWLLVTGRPELLVKAPGPDRNAPTPA